MKKILILIIIILLGGIVSQLGNKNHDDSNNFVTNFENNESQNIDSNQENTEQIQETGDMVIAEAELGNLLIIEPQNLTKDETWYRGVTRESYTGQPAIILDSIIYKEFYDDLTGKPANSYQYLTIDHTQRYVDPVYGVPAYKNENQKLRYHLLDTSNFEGIDYSSSDPKLLYDFRNRQVHIDVNNGVITKIIVPYQS